MYMQDPVDREENQSQQAGAYYLQNYFPVVKDTANDSYLKNLGISLSKDKKVSFFTNQTTDLNLIDQNRPGSLKRKRSENRITEFQIPFTPAEAKIHVEYRTGVDSRHQKR